MQHVAPARMPELLAGYGLQTRPGTPYGLLVGGDSGGPLFATFVGRSVQVGLNCNTTVDSRAAENIRTLFEPGLNTMRVVLKDWCGYDVGNSDLWLTGAAGATPR